MKQSREHGLEDAHPEQMGMSAQALGRISTLLNEYTDSSRLCGAVAAVTRRGKAVYFGTAGYVNLESGRAMPPDAIFRLYSMTKPIASVALMTLYDEGLVSLDDALGHFIPQLGDLAVYVDGPPDAYQVRPPSRAPTVRDALTHMTGIPAGGKGTPGELWNRAGLSGIRGNGGLKGRWTLADMVQRISGLPLLFDPGTRWQYGISTDVLAYICERVSGQPFDCFLRERVLEPLSMSDTSYHVPPEKAERLTSCYRRTEGTIRPLVESESSRNSAYLRPPTYFAGSGGLVSTAPDYLRFCAMLTNGGALDGVRILRRETVALMASNHLPAGEDLTTIGAGVPIESRRPGIGFGLGFGVVVDAAATGLTTSNGEYHWSGAASTYFFVAPREELACVLMTQLQPLGAYPLGEQLREVVYRAIVD